MREQDNWCLSRINFERGFVGVTYKTEMRKREIRKKSIMRKRSVFVYNFYYYYYKNLQSTPRKEIIIQGKGLIYVNSILFVTLLNKQYLSS